MKFLEELAEEFMKTVGLAAAQKAKENSLNTKSKKVLQAMCKKFETPEGGDKTHKVLAAVDGVKAKMQDNISGMLKNQESAESLNEKSAQLAEQANVFKKNSKTLKNTMWWKNIKTTLALGCVVLIVGLLIALPIIANVKGLLDMGGGVGSAATGGGGGGGESSGGGGSGGGGGDGGGG